MEEGDRIPFLRLEEAATLERAMMEEALETMREPADQLIPAENHLTLIHGSHWVHERESDTPAAGGFDRLESVARVPNSEIVEGDINALDRFAAELAEKLLEDMSKRLYRTAAEAADSVGNVVPMGEHGSVPEAFLELLKRVEFGVSRTGEVTRPELHLHPDTAQKIIPILKSQGEDFEREVAKITADKEAAALARESERKAKFRARPEGDYSPDPRDRM